MNAPLPSSLRNLAAGALLLATQALALAQPGDFYLPPDISQLREGLPRGGGSYCGPTSAADLLHWLHENGYPEVPSMGDTEAETTLAVGLLGIAMGTDPVGGTGSQAIVDGLQDILEEAYPGVFDVGFVGRSADGIMAQALGHSFGYIGLQLNAGHLVMTNVGWYVVSEHSFAEGVRCGGHWVAMTGYDFADGAFTARYRDPVSETNTISTKSITDGLMLLEDADEVRRMQFASSWNWDRDPNDCTLNVFRRNGVQDNVIHIGGVRLFSRHGAGGMFIGHNFASGQTTTHAAAPGSPPTSMAVHPYNYDVYHCRPSDPVIFRTGLITNQVSAFPTTAPLNQPRRLAFGYDGVLYVLQGGGPPGFQLLAIRPDGSLAGSAQQSTLGAIAYSEQRNRVYWWDPGQGVVRALALGTQGLSVVATHVLPTGGPAFVAPGYLAIDDGLTADPGDDILYYNHDGGPSIFRFDVEPPMPLAPLIAPPGFNPGEMLGFRWRLYCVDQVSATQVRAWDADGAPDTDSPAAGLTGVGVLAMMRAVHRPLIETYAGHSLNNDIPRDGPVIDCNGNDVPDDVEIAEGWAADADGDGVPDECQCPADFNGDGALNSQDFFDFLAAFFAAAPEADFNGDSAINSQDFFDFLTVFFAGC